MLNSCSQNGIIFDQGINNEQISVSLNDACDLLRYTSSSDRSVEPRKFSHIDPGFPIQTIT